MKNVVWYQDVSPGMTNEPAEQYHKLGKPFQSSNHQDIHPCVFSLRTIIYQRCQVAKYLLTLVLLVDTSIARVPMISPAYAVFSCSIAPIEEESSCSIALSLSLKNLAKTQTQDGEFEDDDCWRYYDGLMENTHFRHEGNLDHLLNTEDPVYAGLAGKTVVVELPR
jgi:hypothetical protein